MLANKQLSTKQGVVVLAVMVIFFSCLWALGSYFSETKTISFTTPGKNNSVKHYVLFWGIKKSAQGFLDRAVARDLDGRYGEAYSDYQRVLTAFDAKTLEPETRLEIARIIYYRSQNCDGYFKAMASSEYLSRWHKSKIKLFVLSGKNGFKPSTRKAIVEGLKVWCEALPKPIQVIEVTDSHDSDVSVIPYLWAIHPWSADGITIEFDRGGAQYELLAEARKRQIALQNIDLAECSSEARGRFISVCRHEMGHVLGLGGHSIFANDLLFFEGTDDNKLAGRDMAAIRQLYQDDALEKITAIVFDAAKNGDPYALVRLGESYQGDRKFKEACVCFNKPSLSGLPQAQECMATMYTYGWGVKKDPQQTFKLYSLAAAQQEPNGIARLGHCYEQGFGVAQDIPKAIQLYQQANRDVCPVALTFLAILSEKGLGMKKDHKLAIKQLEQAAAMGYAKASVCLAKYYESGQGVPQDYKEAFELYDNAAQQGYASGMKGLARMYETGLGVKKDLIKAKDLYEKAAKRFDDD